ncbi:MAG: hypothetical protein LBH60_06145 [Prevotellaceae bacterium]|jgi:hypothetical protein|nr:hypothetical protein [Prevotellaceae bacterium]
MKKITSFFIKSLIVASVCFSVTACNETSEKVSFYDMYPVSIFERETFKTVMHYNGKNVSKFELYENNTLTCIADVFYRADGIVCNLNDIQYHVQPDIVLGATRAKIITANKGNGFYFQTEYFYINERLAYAEVNAPDVPESPFQVNFFYKDSRITIQEAGGRQYTIDLGNEENTGYACNVLGYINAPLTNQYVIIPELYFLNIYGKPVDKLPGGHEITRSGKTLRVGTHTFEYRD